MNKENSQMEMPQGQGSELDNLDLFLNTDIDPILSAEFKSTDYMGQELETQHRPKSRIMRTSLSHRQMKIHLKAKQKNKIKLEHLEALLPSLPASGWQYHVISSGNFDFWTYVPHLVNLAGRFDEFYCSTWTMSRDVAVDMLRLYDQGRIGKISLMTGVYFKRRETAVYALILQGLINRGQRFISFENHTKIMLLGSNEHKIVLEGSANLTANPRVEQFIISHSEQLYNFHKTWMDEMYVKQTRK